MRDFRVVVFLTHTERRKLIALAKQRDLPLGTAAYELLASALRRST